MDDRFSQYLSRLRGFMASPGIAGLEAHGDFEALALELFELQFETVEPYRTFCCSRGIHPGDIRAWQDIPAVPAASFREIDWTSLTSEERTIVFHSSGTTEARPGRHYHNLESVELYRHSAWAWWARHCLAGGSRVGNRLLVLTPSRAKAPHSSLVMMFDAIREGLRQGEGVFAGKSDATGSWGVDAEAAWSVLASAAQTGERVTVLTTALALLELLERLGASARRVRLPDSSCLMETGGYKGRRRPIPRRELYARVEDRLGLEETQIVTEYGMSELSSQAYDHQAGRPLPPSGRRFHFPPWARARVVSPETGREAGEGETGLIRVVDLANVRSVLAVQTEDLGCRRGGGFEFVGRAVGAEARGCSLLMR